MFTRRRFVWYICIALAIGTCYFVMHAVRYQERVDEWRQATPAEFKIDLSIAGDHSGPLHQITQRPCKEIIGVRVESSQPVTRELLNGLVGTISIVSDQEGVIETYPLHYGNYDEWLRLPDKALELHYSHPWNSGHYTLRIHVDKPAPALKGMPQTLIVRYELCGIEGMPILVLSVLAGICSIPAFIIAYCLFVTRKPQQDVVSQG